MEEINKKITKGAAWMVLFKLVERGLGLISTVILARLLLPQDFGLIAMAMSIIAIMELLSAFGFDVALIQNQEATRTHYDTAWTFDVLFAICSTLILIALAQPAAQFYNEPRLAIIIYCLAFSNLISGFENIGIVAFRKEMTFDKEFRFQIVKKFSGFFVTVPLAIWLNNYWALVAGIIASKSAGVLYSYKMHAYRPKFCLAARHELFNFSKWLFFNNALFFAKNKSADFVIGRMEGTQSLGLFSVAYEISNLPTTELVAPINRAVFPGYAKMSHDLSILRQGFLNVLGAIVLFALPAGAGIAVTAELIVQVFLGSNWLETIPLIQVLAFFGVVTAMQSNIVSVYFALGKPKIQTYILAAQLTVLLPMIIVLTQQWGIIGAAWAYLGSALAFLPIVYLIMIRTLSLKIRTLLEVIWRPVLAVSLMLVATEWFIESAQWGQHVLMLIVKLLCSVAIGAAVYVVIICLAWWLSGKPESAEKTLLDKLLPHVQARFFTRNNT